MSDTTTHSTPPTPDGAAGAALEDTAARLDAATAALDGIDAQARAVADELLAAHGALHKEALTTIVRRLRADDRGRELLYGLVDDPTVRMMLAIHGIIRPDPMTLARAALDRVRPNLTAHGGDVELSHLDAGVAYVRLQGACTGCSMSAVTLRDGVTAALLEGVPGLHAVEVLPTEPPPTLIPVADLRRRPGAATDPPAPAAGPAVESAPDDAGVAAARELQQAGWCRAAARRDVAEGTVHAVSLTSPGRPDLDVVVVDIAGRLSCFLNACAHQGRRLDDALVDAAAGTLTCPGHGLSFDIAEGECLSLPGVTLRQLPLRVVGPDVWVRPDADAPS